MEILICFYFFSLEIETNAFSSRMFCVCDCSIMGKWICSYSFSLETETNARSSRMISVCDCSLMVICFSFFFPQIETNSFSLRMIFFYDCSMEVILICFSVFFLEIEASSSFSMMIFVSKFSSLGTWYFLSFLCLGCFSVLLNRLSSCLITWSSHLLFRLLVVRTELKGTRSSR